MAPRGSEVRAGRRRARARAASIDPAAIGGARGGRAGPGARRPAAASWPCSSPATRSWTSPRRPARPDPQQQRTRGRGPGAPRRRRGARSWAWRPTSGRDRGRARRRAVGRRAGRLRAASRRATTTSSSRRSSELGVDVPLHQGRDQAGRAAGLRAARRTRSSSACPATRSRPRSPSTSSCGRRCCGCRGRAVVSRPAGRGGAARRRQEPLRTQGPPARPGALRGRPPRGPPAPLDGLGRPRRRTPAPTRSWCSRRSGPQAAAGRDRRGAAARPLPGGRRCAALAPDDPPPARPGLAEPPRRAGRGADGRRLGQAGDRPRGRGPRPDHDRPRGHAPGARGPAREGRRRRGGAPGRDPGRQAHRRGDPALPPAAAHPRGRRPRARAATAS